MNEVRSVIGIPVPENFGARTGTPIVVDIDTANAYVLKRDGTVGAIGSSSLPDLKRDFGAVGNGVADDSTPFAAFLAAGGGYIPTGTYIVGIVSISAVFAVACGKGVVIKLKDASAASNWITLTAGAVGSEWVGGTFNGNKAGQVFSSNVAVLRLNTVDRVTIHTRIINSLGNAFTTTDCDELDIKIVTQDCNGVSSFARGADSSIDVTSYGTNNNGLAINQHVVDVSDFERSRIRAIIVGQVGDASGLSTFASGGTFVRNNYCNYEELAYLDHGTTAIFTLGFSFVGGQSCTGGEMRVNKTRQAIEYASHDRIAFDSILVDGEYWTTTAVPSADSLTGIVIHANGQYASSQAAISGSRGIHASSVRILRCGTGVLDRSGGNSFANIACIGNTVDGYRLNTNASASASFLGSAASPLEKTVLGVVDFTGNGRAGLTVDECDGLTVGTGRIANNGQDTSLGVTLRSGVYLQTSGTKNRLTLMGVNVDDTQTYTTSVSYQPGTTDASNRYAFTLLYPGRVGIGEWVTLKNVISGPADATGKVVNRVLDTLTIEFPTAKTFVAVLVAGTGTVSSSGTALSGSGTAFGTQVTGRCWIKADGEYRQIVRAPSNTAGTLGVAFTAPLSADAFELVQTDLVGIPSQQYGVYYDANLTDADIDCSFNGNVIAPMGGASVLSSVPETFAPGSEATLYASGAFSTAGATTDLYASVPVGYEIVGYRFQVLTNVTGVESGVTVLGLSLVGGAAVTLATGLTTTANTKSQGAIVPVLLSADTQLRATFSAGADNVPSGGTYRCELRVRRPSFPAFASV